MKYLGSYLVLTHDKYDNVFYGSIIVKDTEKHTALAQVYEHAKVLHPDKWNTYYAKVIEILPEKDTE